MEPEGSIPRLQSPPLLPIMTQINPVHPPPHPTSWSSILILSSHLSLGPPSSVFLSGFHAKTLYALFLFHILAACHAHLILFDLINRIIFGKEYRRVSTSLCSFLHSPVISSLLSPNMFLSTIFSKTLSLRSFLNVSDHVSHPYKTTGKVIFLYIIIFIFLGSKLEDKILHRMIASS